MSYRGTHIIFPLSPPPPPFNAKLAYAEALIRALERQTDKQKQEMLMDKIEHYLSESTR